MATSSTAYEYSGGLREAIGRRLYQTAGAALCLFALYLLLAMASYHSADPSLNHATTEEIKNIGGYPGAVLSDLLLQVFGLTGLLMSAALAAWGWRMLQMERLSYIGFRVCAFVGALLICSFLLSMIGTPSGWALSGGLGGALGVVTRHALTGILPLWAWGIIATTLTLVLIPLSFGLYRHEWEVFYRLWRMVWRSVTMVFGLIRDVLHGEAVAWQERISQRYVEEDYDEENTHKEDEEEDAEDGMVLRRKRGERQSQQGSKRQPAAKSTGTVSRNQKSQKKQPSLELRARQGEYVAPSCSLLQPGPPLKRTQLSDAALKQNARMLATVLDDFGVKGEITNIRPGPVVTLYELEPAAGTKSARVIGLADDIARSMSAVSARIAVIPGRNAIGIELPNRTRETVYLRDVFEDDIFARHTVSLPLALGRDIGGDPVVTDLARMPHLLVAGTTGSGKSVAINTMILSLLYQLTPEQCKFIMIDPKMLELSVYEGIPHLLTPVVTEPAKAVVALKWVVREMENRYRLMANLGVRNIDSYNKRVREAKRTGEVLEREVQTGFDPETGRPVFEKQDIEMVDLPFIVVIVDEMADLMLVAGKDIETSIQRLAQMARAAGIHIIMATQRPSVDVITGVIKANFPTRISFQVTSKIDSRTILGEQGAEQLLGQGDMLYMAGGGRITRVHGPFVSDKEVEEVVSYLKTQGTPHYIEDVTADDDSGGDGFEEEDESEEDKLLYDRAVAIVSRDRKASTSYVQRALKIGYNRAARLIEKMERDGVVSAANHVGKREVLTRRDDD